MFLQFLGTRGEIELSTPRHQLHSSLLVVHSGKRIMVDCGSDWRDELGRIRPDAIALTHANPDHAAGLRDGAPCPVYATAEAHKGIAEYPIAKRETIKLRTPREIQGATFEAFAVDHSARCPAVGYRISGGGVTIFYCPDVAEIPDLGKALKDVCVYIGDGASLTRGLLRKKGNKVLGHASIRSQLEWCAEHGVRRAFFTHCGTEIVSQDGRGAARGLRVLAREFGVTTKFAHDSMQTAISKGA